MPFTYCPQREENARLREQNKRPQYRDPVIQQAWERSDSGRAFKVALEEEGYQLAQGTKRMVVVDKWGKIQNPVRHLDVKAKDFRERCRDLDPASLPEAAALRQEVKKRDRAEYHARREEEACFDRDQANIDWEQGVIDAAIAAEKERPATKKRPSRAKGGSSGGKDSPALLSSFAAELDVIQARERAEQQRRDALEKQLDEFYKTEDTERELEETRAKLAKAGFLAKATGRRRELERRAESLEQNLENMRQRRAEAVEALERQIEAERAQEEALKARQQAPRPDREAKPQERDKSHDRDQGSGYDLGL